MWSLLTISVTLVCVTTPMSSCSRVILPLYHTLLIETVKYCKPCQYRNHTMYIPLARKLDNLIMLLVVEPVFQNLFINAVINATCIVQSVNLDVIISLFASRS